MADHKTWQRLGFDECPVCGAEAEAKALLLDGLFTDGDEVRCVACHYPGVISVCDVTAYVEWEGEK